jgi:hypothetical protein
VIGGADQLLGEGLLAALEAAGGRADAALRILDALAASMVPIAVAAMLRAGEAAGVAPGAGIEACRAALDGFIAPVANKAGETLTLPVLDWLACQLLPRLVAYAAREDVVGDPQLLVRVVDWRFVVFSFFVFCFCSLCSGPFCYVLYESRRHPRPP